MRRSKFNAKISPCHFLRTFFYRAPCVSRTKQISFEFSLNIVQPRTPTVLKDRASDERLRVRFRGRSQCNCGSGIRGAATCNAPTCNARAYVCVYVSISALCIHCWCVRVCIVCVFARVSICASGAGVRSGNHRGRDARRGSIPNFAAEKLDAASLRSHPEVRASIRNADRPRRLRFRSSPLPRHPFLRSRRGKILKTQRGETWKKIRGAGEGQFRSARKYFANNVGEICRRNFNYVSSPSGRESLRLINIFARMDIIKYKGSGNSIMFSISRVIEISFRGAGKI